MSAQEREVVGEIRFSGTLPHGGYLSKEDLDVPFLDLSYPYRNYFLIREKDNSASHQGLDRFNDRGLTLGPGLYTTTLEEARKYAYLRAGRHSFAVLDHLVVEDARFFDFRRVSDPQLNGDVPVEVAREWQKYYATNQHLVVEFFERTSEVTRRQLLQALNSYPGHLEDFIDRLQTGRRFEPETYRPLGYRESSQTIFGTNRFVKRDQSLRDMLRTIPEDTDWTHSWFGGLWVRFVEDQLGCAGVIAIEAGDAEEFNSAPTTVIYNLGVIKSQKTEVLTT